LKLALSPGLACVAMIRPAQSNPNTVAVRAIIGWRRSPMVAIRIARIIRCL
jgi:hypothetical protein